MRVAIVGSRFWTDPEPIHTVIDGLMWREDTLLSGGAPGADDIALRYADRSGLRWLVFEPDWNTYGASAGPRRNARMVLLADMLVAFWDGRVEHSGTLDAVRKAVAKEIPVIVYWQRKDRQ